MNPKLKTFIRSAVIGAAAAVLVAWIGAMLLGSVLGNHLPAIP